MDWLREYRKIWCLDTEFCSRDGVCVYEDQYARITGNPPIPVALAAIEYHSGQRIVLDMEQLAAMKAPPYDISADSLVCCFFGPAEMNVHLALGWPLPANLLDLYAENKNHVNTIRERVFANPNAEFVYNYQIGREEMAGADDGDDVPTEQVEHERRTKKKGFGLAAALARLGIDIDTAHKEAMRARIMAGPPYAPQEMRDILSYCTSDTSPLKDLLEDLAPTINIDHALHRGDYSEATAVIESRGLPIDPDVTTFLMAHWAEIQHCLVKKMDVWGIWDGLRFRRERFFQYLVANGIPWPRTESGTLSLEDSRYFKPMSKKHPELYPIRQLRNTLSQLKTFNYPIGSDWRHRTLLSPFGTVTGRNTPSKYVLLGPKWLRYLIKAPEGKRLVVVDWTAQEVAIGAALSGDQRRAEAYASDDFYLRTAVQVGALPHGAVRCPETEAIRNIYKVVVLALQYGQGSKSLSFRLETCEREARRIIDKIKKYYYTFENWTHSELRRAKVAGMVESHLGWRAQVLPHSNRDTILNFPIQSRGADLLRAAVIRAVESGLPVVASVHDSIRLESDACRAEADMAQLQEIMCQVGREILGGFELRSEGKIYASRYADEKGEAMWNTIIEIIHDMGYSKRIES
jgi:DNA polymerase I